MESTTLLTPPQIALLLGSNASIWPLLNESTRQELSTAFHTILADRDCGLLELKTVENNDCLEASTLRRTFHKAIVEPILSLYATQSAVYKPEYPEYKGTTGYVVGINQFHAIGAAFADSEAVQICFGMDNLVEEGGQFQLIFRGIGGPVHPQVLFVTGKPGEGGPTDGSRIRPCPPNAQC